MKIIDLKTQHLTNPLGFELSAPVFSFKVTETEAGKLLWSRVEIAADAAFADIRFDSGPQTRLNAMAYAPDFKPEPCTRYWWRVSALADDRSLAQSEPAWFETAKAPGDWLATWISHDFPSGRGAVFSRGIEVRKPLRQARAYILGLGLYESYLNGRKTGQEYLAPGCHAYDKWLQYQTYDLTEQLQSLVGQPAEWEIWTADGWYCGRFGYKGQTKIYGSQQRLLAELLLEYEDGSREMIATDDQWQVRLSPISFANIYDGETYDANLKLSPKQPVVCLDDQNYDHLTPRLSPPVVCAQRLPVKEIIHTPAGETVLDMGQNMVGWLEARLDEPSGQEVTLQFGEVLQNGCFYKDNLRTALQTFRYISDGKARTIRQHFTFFGFRYVKVSGLTQAVRAEDFVGLVLHTRLERIGRIETADPLVNRLYQNAWWGQRGNFLDVPTDCPQRDERLGWTGDAQAFSGTACFNADTYAFYRKYCHDLALEQADLGTVPYVAPMMGMREGGSTAWGDAATVIPWTVYLHSGDAAILRQQYDSMKAWVDYMAHEASSTGDPYLWSSGFHFADWLALDNFRDPESCFGGTDPYLIATAYFYYSTRIVAQTAGILGQTADQACYESLARHIQSSFQQEYLTPAGRLACDTQTAYVVTLFMELAPEEQRPRLAAALRQALERSRERLETGFVGTTYLCRVLSHWGMNELAYTLLLNREYPGWLYEVLLGATTIWERWNSLLPDGRVSDTGMNSLNHYTYGSIVEWMYRDMLGINPVAAAPGFKQARLEPKPDPRIRWARGSVDTAAGLYISQWHYTDDGRLGLCLQLPFDTTATLRLPYCRDRMALRCLQLPCQAELTDCWDWLEQTAREGQPLAALWPGLPAAPYGQDLLIPLSAGCYSFYYEPV
ncbi:family 78 glycoside hydrolase catalytic domain [Oscillospiraceae bacterium HV4-5-C5C]|nr:family 78 glycoside hydrolase catalytic domain [Oscillospiraceae bacterium HV4-5-C5C]